MTYKRTHSREKKLNIPKAVLSRFADGIKRVCIASGAEEAFSLLAKRDLYYLYMCSEAPFQVKFDNEIEFNKIFKHTLYKKIKELFCSEMISYKEGAPPVSLWDHFEFASSFNSIVVSDKSVVLHHHHKLRKLLSPLIAYQATIDEHSAFTRAMILCDRLATVVSNMESYIMKIKVSHGVRYPKELKGHIKEQLYYCATVYMFRPLCNVIRTKDGNRRGFAVCDNVEPYTGKKCWLELPTSSYGIDSRSNSMSPVYFTAHAIHRLKERIDCLQFGYAQGWAHQSLLDCKEDSRPIKRNLIPYYVETIKAGYLAYEFTGTAVLIKTFLLLSNHGTPEGNKLARELGFKKEDSAYLKLGRLSTLVSSNLLDSELEDSFERSGMTGLKELSQYIDNKQFEKKEVADEVIDYINKREVFLAESKDDKEAFLNALMEESSEENCL